MHIYFAMGGMNNKHVLGGKMRDRLLKDKMWSEAFKKVCEALNKECNVGCGA